MAFDVRRLVALGRVASLAVSPDGRFAVCAVMQLDEGGSKYVSSLWRVPLDGSAAVRLTHGKHNDRAPCFRHDGALGFLSNRPVKGAGLEITGPQEADTEERDQVWILAEGSDARPLTDEPLGVQSFQFAPEGDVLLVAASVLPGVELARQRAAAKEFADNGPTALHYPNRFGPFRHWDHWLGRARPHLVAYDARGDHRRDLTPNADREYTADLELALSRDGTLLAAVERVEADDRIFDPSIRVVATRDGASRLLLHGKQVEHGHPLFSADGAHLYFNRMRRSPERHGRVDLCVLELGSGETKVLCPSWDRWPAPKAALRDGRLVVTADDEGTVPVFVVSPATSEVVRVTGKQHGGTHEALSTTADGRVVGIRHGLRSPPEPFVVEAKPDQTPRMLASLSGFDPRDVEPFEVTTFDVAAGDGARIQTWLVRPSKPHATMLWIHGGPVGAFGDGWHWRWNPMVLAAAGYAVALPNARGSTGFGTDFVEGIWKNSWGGACYDDLMRVTDALEKTPGLDPKRIAAMGGSFGGYMCNFIGGHTQRFRALVSHAGIFHLEAMTGASDYGPYFALEVGTTTWKDRAEFEKHSPHRFVGAWKTPTLVIHGEKDYRCPISEALILYDALQEHGVESELVVFPDENHWILKPRNIEAWYGHVLRFLGEHV